MLGSSIWFFFQLASIASLPSVEKFASIGKIGIFHGIGVVTMILLVPTLLASYGLLSSERTSKSILGIGFAIPWILIELIAHCSQTAPLNSLSELASEPSTATIGASLYTLWAEWGEALFMTGAFLSMLLAICYGVAFHVWGNAVTSYLFFGAALAFPLGILLNMEVHLHVLIRGVAFLFLGGVLIQAPSEDTL